jgi:hypothetical protein
VLQINTFGPTGSLGQNGVVNVEAGATLLVTKAWAQFALGTISPVLNLNGGNLAGMTLTVVSPVGTQTQGSVQGFGTISGAIELGDNVMTITSSGVNFRNATLASSINGGTFTGTRINNFGFITGAGYIGVGTFTNRSGGTLLVQSGATVTIENNWTNTAGGTVRLENGRIDGVAGQGNLTNFGTVSGGGSMSVYVSNMSGAYLHATSPFTVSGLSNAAGGTIHVQGTRLRVEDNWINNGTLRLQGGSVKSLAIFTNNGITMIGSSIDSNFHNTGTFSLLNHTSITGNFTNSGWTDLGGFALTTHGSIGIANQGNGNTTGVITGGGSIVMSPGAGSNATFSNNVTSAVNDGGNYDTRTTAFALTQGTINFEVLSTDVGSSLSNVPNVGFSMGTLTLPNTLSLLRLLDDTVNQGGGTQEAIYVQNLHLGSLLTASNFDFGPNSLKIYYNHIIGDGGANFVGTYDGAARVIYFGNIIPLSGAPAAVVPEPSTLFLMLLGLPVAFLAYRRWRRTNV